MTPETIGEVETPFTEPTAPLNENDTAVNPITTTAEEPTPALEPELPAVEIEDAPVAKPTQVQTRFVPPTKPVVSNSRIVEGRKGGDARVPFDAVKDDR